MEKIMLAESVPIPMPSLQLFRPRWVTARGLAGGREARVRHRGQRLHRGQGPERHPRERVCRRPGPRRTALTPSSSQPQDQSEILHQLCV